MEVPFHVQQEMYATACLEHAAAEKRDHWAVVLGLTPKRDGNQWCILWGDDLASGVAGFGSTPEDAIIAFESAMGQCGGHSTVQKR